MTTTGQKIRAKREAKSMSLEALRDDLRDVLPKRFIPSSATLARIETGKIASVDTVLVVAVANVLGCGIGELSPEAADELDTLRHLLEHTSPCISAHPTLFELARCN